MILAALDSHSDDQIILVTDVDVIFLYPLQPPILYYINSGLDILFQRNDDVTLEANIGFMAMRCNERVRTLWKVVREIVRLSQPGSTEKPPIKGGDQRIVNKLLRNLGYLETSPDLRWGYFPPEFVTQVTDR